MSDYAIVFLGLGESYIEKINNCIQKSTPIRKYDRILITDTSTNIDDAGSQFTKIIRAEFENENLLRKAELIKFLPGGYRVYLYLDSDTIVLHDISLGFEKAEQFLMAMVPSPHYSLDHFWDFGSIMDKEHMSRKGHLQYNSGVIFFKDTPKVREVLERWYFLAKKHQYHNDQPLITMAMEQLQFNPYTLSPSYNYQGLGELISGEVYLWHSHFTLPENINTYDKAWPPRRVIRGKVEYFGKRESLRKIIISRLKTRIHRWLK